MLAVPRVVLAVRDLFPGGLGEADDVKDAFLSAATMLGGIGPDDFHLNDTSARPEAGVAPCVLAGENWVDRFRNHVQAVAKLIDSNVASHFVTGCQFPVVRLSRASLRAGQSLPEPSVRWR